MDEKLETEIPLEFIGESKAIKELGGMLVKTTDKVLVSCLPADLPKHFEVDIAALQTFDDHIKVGDLTVSAKVQVLTDPEVVIALVERPRTDEEIAKLNEKVEEDVTKVQGVVKETPVAEEVKEK
jgi:large subunit ribosomal protein L25